MTTVGGQPVISVLSSRQQELMQKKQAGTIAPSEEGELRGRFAHPGNTRAQELVQKEYLALQGLGEFSHIEQEELRQIRQQDYAAKHRFEARASLAQEAPRSNGSLVSNHNDQLQREFTQAKIICLQNALTLGQLDFAIFTKLIDDLLDKPLILPKDDPTIYSKQAMPKLAALLLTCCDGINIGSDTQQHDGSLTVIAGINCLKDQVRTKKFLESVAISIDKLTESRESNIHVVDAGCGAIPIFSIYAAMCSDKVNVTAIELNPNSFQIAQRLVAKLGLEDRITLIQADATTYKPKTPIDLLISETMHSGLTQEKIVPIMHNLVPQVKEHGIVLPESVKVKVGVASLLEYEKTERMVVFYSTPHMHIVPEWQDELTFKPGEDLQEIRFELNTEGLKPGTYLVSVSSEVGLPAGNLGDFDSLITSPQIVLEANSSPTDATPLAITLKESDIGNKKIVVSYKPGDTSNGIAKLI